MSIPYALDIVKLTPTDQNGEPRYGYLIKFLDPKFGEHLEEHIPNHKPARTRIAGRDYDAVGLNYASRDAASEAATREMTDLFQRLEKVGHPYTP